MSEDRKTATIGDCHFFSTWDHKDDMYYKLWNTPSSQRVLGQLDMNLADYWSDQYVKNNIFGMTLSDGDYKNKIPAGLWIDDYRHTMATSGTDNYIEWIEEKQMGALVLGDATINAYYEFRANIEGFLGIGYAVDSPDKLDGSQIQYVSTKIPEVQSLQNCYVRINSLGMRSLNGLSSSISKIIGSIPLNNGSKTSGRMHNDVDNLIFLDLNNDTDMMINNIDIDLVDLQERYTTFLSDGTTIVFLIRKKNM
tara:strand:- start:1208 stop:1963 length:756 start_codon:yes stop_codon:yes gene_type:complete